MFGLFGNNKEEELPVNDEARQWIERATLWLINSFGEDSIKKRKILTPHHSNFPIKYNGEHQTAIDTMKIIAEQMEINPNDIQLDIYTEGQTEVGTGASRIFMQQVEGEKYSGGLYWGKQDDNKYHIGLEEKKLKEPLDMVATLSHEFSHIKLLGEKRIEKNNEPLTDLTTVIFGLGIFNANAAFQTRRGVDSWSWSKLGYLSQMEWGYALALFAYVRGEKSPEWINFLAKNVKSDFKKSENYIYNNKDKIFKSSDTTQKGT
ncbi:MAG TPA: hypothetical protein VNG53_06995 [Bacteroidia bacterium]|nr:hypothetical protein [Bacteroidia bacterium]